MKKVLFLMVLLLLIGLGTASLSAQVRIGGNAAPNASALLDLNATDATNNGTKGLALPRVDLTSKTMLLSGVTSNLTGMMVYNTTATLGRIGIYYWNGAQWVLASLPSTSATDSGKVLMSSGIVAYWGTPFSTFLYDTLTITARSLGTPIWTKVLDTALTVSYLPSRITVLHAAGFNGSENCKAASYGIWLNVSTTFLYVWRPGVQQPVSDNMRIQCYRPSI